MAEWGRAAQGHHRVGSLRRLRRPLGGLSLDSGRADPLDRVSADGDRGRRRLRGRAFRYIRAPAASGGESCMVAGRSVRRISTVLAIGAVVLCRGVRRLFLWPAYCPRQPVLLPAPTFPCCASRTTLAPRRRPAAMG